MQGFELGTPFGAFTSANLALVGRYCIRNCIDLTNYRFACCCVEVQVCLTWAILRQGLLYRPKEEDVCIKKENIGKHQLMRAVSMLAES